MVKQVKTIELSRSVHWDVPISVVEKKKEKDKNRGKASELMKVWKILWLNPVGMSVC
jgi:hypothetical protein